VKKVEYGELASAPNGPLTPATATKDAPFINSLGMKFVPVPITGGPANEQRVLFSIWETRVQDYEAFIKATDRQWSKPSFAHDASHPALNVNWLDSTAFCEWLNRRERAEGGLGAASVYRLPADHEWSCAAGIGEREEASQSPQEKSGRVEGAYPWGSAWPPPGNSGNLRGDEAGPPPTSADALPGYRDPFAKSSPVGQFSPNSLGLYDLAGNAREWCEDWFDRAQTGKMLRGSGYQDGNEAVLRSSFRHREGMGSRFAYNGFRVVLASSAPSATSAPTK
jgi:formylglycine-generating enzyme required for sulfatase activity